MFPNDTIFLNKNNQVNIITCASVNSNPDVSLSIYDTNSMLPISTASNSIIQKSCNNSLCTNILQVNFQITGNSFDNLTSLTCFVNSTNSQVALTSLTSRAVSFITPGRVNERKFCICFKFKSI